MAEVPFMQIADLVFNEPITTKQSAIEEHPLYSRVVSKGIRGVTIK